MSPKPFSNAQHLKDTSYYFKNQKRRNWLITNPMAMAITTSQCLFQKVLTLRLILSRLIGLYFFFLRILFSISNSIPHKLINQKINVRKPVLSHPAKNAAILENADICTIRCMRNKQRLMPMTSRKTSVTDASRPGI